MSVLDWKGACLPAGVDRVAVEPERGLPRPGRGRVRQDRLCRVVIVVGGMVSARFGMLVSVSDADRRVQQARALALVRLFPWAGVLSQRQLETFAGELVGVSGLSQGAAQAHEAVVVAYWREQAGALGAGPGVAEGPLEV